MLHRIMDMQILLYAMAGVGILGIFGMAALRLAYRRRIRRNSRLPDPKEKWMASWGSRNAFARRMNRWVWVPSFTSALLLCLAAVLSSTVLQKGMVPSLYFQVGAAVPVVLLVVRQALDFTDKEGLLIRSMADYLEDGSRQAAEAQAAAAAAAAPEDEDAMVDHVAGGIMGSTGEKGKFGELLSPEEEEIMREVIREFME